MGSGRDEWCNHSKGQSLKLFLPLVGILFYSKVKKKLLIIFKQGNDSVAIFFSKKCLPLLELNEECFKGKL